MPQRRRFVSSFPVNPLKDATVYDRRAIATRIKEKASKAGHSFAFHFFVRFGNEATPKMARDFPIARQFFDTAASEVLAGIGEIDDADRPLLSEYALAAVEVAFQERLAALVADREIQLTKSLSR